MTHPQQQYPIILQNEGQPLYPSHNSNHGHSFISKSTLDTCIKNCLMSLQGETVPPEATPLLLHHTGALLVLGSQTYFAISRSHTQRHTYDVTRVMTNHGPSNNS